MAHKKRQARLTIAQDINLLELYGAGDCNLLKMKEKLGVEIAAKGYSVTISADDYKLCQDAKKVMEELASIVKNGRSVTEDIVENKISAVRNPGGTLASTFNGAALHLRAKHVVPRNESQAKYLQGILTHEVSFGVGDAGTGKTWLAVAAAVAALERGEVKRIVLCRPAVEAGEKLGFLPGDQKEKVDPYFQPIYDALRELLPTYENLIKNNTIEIAPLAFMRGRTLSNAFVILDEAQNTTRMQMKMFLTRMGEGSKMVITGDHTQIDLPDGESESGLVHALRANANDPEIFIHKFTPKDVVRHRMVGRILDNYEQLAASEQTNQPIPAPKR